jgi:Uma2 family endonuclease
MSSSTEKLTRERFRELYADRKPNFELIDGVAEQKAMGSKRHAFLQGILYRMLEELGFRTGTELTVAISQTWEPVPDVAGLVGPETDEVYQSQPPAVVIEILSPSDRFTLLDQKCRRYAFAWLIPTAFAAASTVLWAIMASTRPFISFTTRFIRSLQRTAESEAVSGASPTSWYSTR